MFQWKRTFYYRRPPYPYYDIEGIESWLEDLADEGLFLNKDGYVFGYMQFRRGSPCKTKYRLEAIQRANFLHLYTPNDPDEKALALFEEFGWEYLGPFYDFYIYRSVGENAPELNTDPAIQAMTLENVKKRSRRSSLLLLLLTAVCFYLLFRIRPISRIINDGWLAILLLLVAVVAAVGTVLAGYLHIAGLQKRLHQGTPLRREKNWKQGVLRRRLWIAFPSLLLLAYHIVNLCSVSPIEAHTIDPDSYQFPLPFATASEIAPEREYISEAQPQLSNWNTLLSPVNLFWCEEAHLESPDENSYYGGLEIYYHETAAEWIAVELMEEYLDVQKKYTAYAPVTVSAEEYGFDSLEIYESYYGARIYIRDGSTVVKAFSHLRIQGNNDHLYPLWLDLMAEKMA